MTVVPSEYALLLAMVLFTLGLVGVLVRRNILFILLSIEIMLNAAGLAFVSAGARWAQPDGQVMFIFILAMAAARLLHRPVLATDIEPWSVRVARQNAALNGLRGLVRFRLADGWRHPVVRRNRPYDLVFANNHRVDTGSKGKEVPERPFPFMDKEISPALFGKELFEGIHVPFNDHFHAVAGLEQQDTGKPVSGSGKKFRLASKAERLDRGNVRCMVADTGNRQGYAVRFSHERTSMILFPMPQPDLF